MIQSREAPWAVELVDFRKTFRPHWSRQPVVAVQGVTLHVAAGQVLGLLGPNGSGKSTTLKAMAGLLRPSAGVCRILGADPAVASARGFIGYAPESCRLSPHQTGREFLTYCAGLSGAGSDRVDATLAWSGLGHAADRRMTSYSKGMMQRVALAQAVLADPPVVLLDEPTGGLDPAGRLAVGRLICELRARGTTVVFTSHLLDHAEEGCDLIAILGQGRVLALGTPDELMGGPRPATVQPSRLERLYLEKTGANG